MITGDGTVVPGSLISDTFTRLFLQAAAKCQDEWDFISCQTLANLCVLLNYDETAPACLFYQTIAKKRSFASYSYLDKPEGIPWLYYGFLNTETAISTVSKAPNIIVDITLTSSYSSLAFVGAKYALNGTYLGLFNVSTEFQFCPDLISLKWFNAGHNYNVNCNLNIYNLAFSGSETIFYELCIF